MTQHNTQEITELRAVDIEMYGAHNEGCGCNLCKLVEKYYETKRTLCMPDTHLTETQQAAQESIHDLVTNLVNIDILRRNC